MSVSSGRDISSDGRSERVDVDFGLLGNEIGSAGDERIRGEREARLLGGLDGD